MAWERTSNRNVFAVSFSNYSLLLELVPETEDLQAYITFRILNTDGWTVEEVSAHQAAMMGFDEMNELYDAARRAAMGLDAALDDLLNELDTAKEPKKK